MSEHARAPGFREPVRLLFLLATASVGGTETSVALLVSALDRRRVRPFVATVSPPGPMTERLASAGVLAGDLGVRSPVFPVGGVARLRRLVARLDPQVIYEFGMTSALLTEAAALRGDVRRIFAHRGAVRERGLKLALKRRLSNASHAAIYNSAIIRDTAVRQLGFRADHSHVVPNGAPPEALEQPSARDRRALLGGVGISDADLDTSRIVVTVANMRPEKDYDTLLHAMRRVVDEDSRVRMIAIGDGRERDRILALRRQLGLDSRVMMPGFRADALSFVAAADLFVLSSHTESFPNALLEAMALSVPVIATSVGGVPELIDSPATGITVPAENASALANAILQMLRSPELRRRTGDAGRQRVRDRFSVAAAARRTEDIVIATASTGSHVLLECP